MILKNGITLYHGSYCPVKNIDLAFCIGSRKPSHDLNLQTQTKRGFIVSPHIEKQDS